MDESYTFLSVGKDNDICLICNGELCKKEKLKTGKI